MRRDKRAHFNNDGMDPDWQPPTKVRPKPEASSRPLDDMVSRQDLLSVEIFKFDCNGHNAPAYGCNKPGDNSGEYVRLADFERIKAQLKSANGEGLSVREHFLIS